MQIFVVLLQRIVEGILLFIGKHLIEKIHRHIEIKKQKKIQDQNLKKYKEAVGGKADDDTVLETERDLLNGDNSSIMQ